MNKILVMVLIPLSLSSTYSISGERYNVIWPYSHDQESDRQIIESSKKLLAQEIHFKRLSARQDNIASRVFPLSHNFNSANESENHNIKDIQRRISAIDELFTQIREANFDLEKATQEEESKNLRRQQFHTVDQLKKKIITDNEKQLQEAEQQINDLENTLEETTVIFLIHFVRNQNHSINTILKIAALQKDLNSDLEFFSNTSTISNDKGIPEEHLERFMNIFPKAKTFHERILSFSQQFRILQEHNHHLHSLTDFLDVERQVIKDSNTSLAKASEDLATLQKWDGHYRTEIQEQINYLISEMRHMMQRKIVAIPLLIPKLDYLLFQCEIANCLKNTERFTKLLANLVGTEFECSIEGKSFQDLQNDLQRFIQFLRESSRIATERKTTIEKQREETQSLVELPKPKSYILCRLIASPELTALIKEYPVYHFKISDKNHRNKFDNSPFSHLYFLSTGRISRKLKDANKKNAKKKLTPTDKLIVKHPDKEKYFQFSLDCNILGKNLILSRDNSGNFYFQDTEKHTECAYHLDHLAFVRFDSPAEQSPQS